MEIELITQRFLNPLICKQPSDPAKISSIKIILLGNLSVGKKCILEQFYFEPFPKNSNQLKSENKLIMVANIIMGFPDLKKILVTWKTLLKGIHVLVLCYDVANVQSFFEMKVLLQMARESIFDETILDVLVAIKIDPEEQRQISKLDGQIFAEENDLQYYEVSAKDWCRKAYNYEVKILNKQ